MWDPGQKACEVFHFGLDVHVQSNKTGGTMLRWSEMRSTTLLWSPPNPQEEEEEVEEKEEESLAAKQCDIMIHKPSPRWIGTFLYARVDQEST